MRFINRITRLLLPAFLVSLLAVPTAAQDATPDKVISSIEAMPRQQAKEALTAVLDDANTSGRKTYKNLLTSFEEMLSEPTWDYHNEELFALLIEHAMTATSLNSNDKMRPKALLDVVHKNAPGQIANDISFETFDGSRYRLSDITTPYTLIYFNDPECFSCAKVKERLDTATTLMSMVADSTLTVVGIYPYDNVEEWKLEPFPSYIINGWEFEQKIEGEQTYDLMTMPLFYLLDSDKRVILKNEASLNRVLNCLSKLKGMEDKSIEDKLNAVF